MKSITAIICITVIVIFAVWQGHNSAIVGIACGTIGGIAGVPIGKVLERKRHTPIDKEPSATIPRNKGNSI